MAKTRQCTFMEREYCEETCKVLKLALTNFNIMLGCYSEESIDLILNDINCFPLRDEYPFDEPLDEVVSKLHSIAEKIQFNTKWLRVGE